MNIKHLAIAAFAAMAAFAAPVMADTKVAVLDTQEVVNSTNAAKRAVESLKKQRDDAQKKINAMEAPLIEKQKKLVDQRAVMAADKFAEAEGALRKEVGQFRAQAVSLQENLAKENARLFKSIADAVRNASEAIAKEKGYDLILPKSVIIYSSAGVADISADVLSRANTALDK